MLSNSKAPLSSVWVFLVIARDGIADFDGGALNSGSRGVEDRASDGAGIGAGGLGAERNGNRSGEEQSRAGESLHFPIIR